MSNPKFDGNEHQIVPGVLRGFRQWMVYPDGLHAWSVGVRWTAEVNTAIHLNVGLRPVLGSRAAVAWRGLHRVDVPDDQPAPVKGCVCGFYAFYRPDLRGMGRKGISGSIKAYGHVILGEKGFKAQHVEIESLWIPDSSMSALPAVVRKFYPDVPVFDTWEDLTRAFPPIPVTELIGPPEPEHGDEGEVKPTREEGVFYG